MVCILASLKSVQCEYGGDGRKMGTDDKLLGLQFSRRLTRQKLWVFGGACLSCRLPSSSALRQLEWTLGLVWKGGDRFRPDCTHR